MGKFDAYLFSPCFAGFPCNTPSISASNRLRLTKKFLAAGHPVNFQTAPRVLSAKFRGKFLALLKARFPTIDKSLLDICYQKKWVVYCKPPFDNVGKVISYLGRYTHRVAISNDRILSMGNGKVTFRWRDYAHGNQMKRMTLDAEEFIRRFLLHILPAGFRKIRHYGLFAARSKEKRLALCRRLTDTPQPSQELPPMSTPI